jgi:iron complex outermembrane recepter protein
LNKLQASVSGAALVLGAFAGLPDASAQQAAAPSAMDAVQTSQPSQAAATDQEPTDRVVVTGTLIRGAAEDAALPVEVYSIEDLEESGAPTALEFVKRLTISGPTTGEAYFTLGAGTIGQVQVNLRGLGADKTLTLLNGRRVNENTSNIPSAALARIEILKDGAAVTYGADATGGVVNYITRDRFRGFEAKAQYKYVDGSDGDYGLSFLGGFGEGDTNFLWSAEWDHRSRLETEDRPFSSLPYNVNPTSWTAQSNLAGWTPRGVLPAVPGNTAAAEFGAALSATPIADFTPASCAAVRGAYVSTSQCSYTSTPYLNLVEDQDIYRIYAQLKSRLTDNMDFRVSASYGQVKAPQVFGAPGSPLTRGPARAIGAADQIYVPVANPFVAEFAQRSGWATNPAFANTRGYTARTYRTFGHGGNPLFGEGNGFGGVISVDNQVWQVSSGLSGELGETFGSFKDVGFDFAVTYNQAISLQVRNDVLGFRLQEALNGFGGPNCTAQDLDPYRFGTQNAAAAGRNGCQWWNPFASNFPSQPELGLANPSYVPGSENPLDLTKWLFGDDQRFEDVNSSLIVDLVLDSSTGVNLPGGSIDVAGGFQWRQVETREIIGNPFFNGATPCEWPTNFTTGLLLPDGPDAGTDPDIELVSQTPRAATDPRFTGCTLDEPGPYVFQGIDRPDAADQQQYSFFGQADIPLLDNVNLTAAVRREEFSGGLGATVYKVSGKWDVFGPLSLRGSYGTNYQAPPAGLVPGEVVNAVSGYTKLGGNFTGTQTVTVAGIKPETATVWNVGLIWQSQGFTSDSSFTFLLDYFDIETEDEIGLLASVNDIAGVVFPGANNGTAQANCSHPLISRVTFNGGACVQGVTLARDFSQIRTDFGNGPGQTTAGFDLQIDYTMPIGPGEASVGVTATQVTELKSGPTSLDGFLISGGDDRLGFRNFGSTSFAAPEVRANAYANYVWGEQNFRLALNFVSGVVDERGPVTPQGLTTPTTFGVAAEDWIAADFHYSVNLPGDVKVFASVENIFDQDPPPSREQIGYDPKIGSALGRTFEIGLKKSF